MIKRFIEPIGRYCLFLKMVFRRPEKWGIFWRQFVLETDKLILSSIVIVGVISVFIGGVLVIQTASNMSNPVLDRMLETDTDYGEALDYFHETGLDNPEGYRDTMDGIADMLGEVSPKLKDDLVLLCMMVCAVDGEISSKERDWIRQLIE